MQQELIWRYCGEKQSRLLRSDLWHGQQHGRRGGPLHSRFMRPRCDIVPEGKRHLIIHADDAKI